MNNTLDHFEQNVHINWLIDYYGTLLTQKQQDILSLYYKDDYSLSEIAKQYSVSRQNVHDLINRSIKKMVELEDSLGLIKRNSDSIHLLKQALTSIEYGDISSCRQNLIKAIEIMEGE